MKVVKICAIIILVVLLTIVTQVGGIVLLLSMWLSVKLSQRIRSGWQKTAVKTLTFPIVYTITSVFMLPVLSRPLGRVPLPIFAHHNVRPANMLTCLLNRHYVTPSLRETLFTAGGKMQAQYPGTIINYLDANFPIPGVPLLPHLSHNDGRKLDISFCYSTSSGAATNDVPSLTGYGISEGPIAGEINTCSMCEQQGYHQYGLLNKLTSQGNKKQFLFDGEKTKFMAGLFTSQRAVEKIFIEPHLKTRLGLTGPKVRFQGCHAVRHDDHIHIQVYR